MHSRLHLLVCQIVAGCALMQPPAWAGWPQRGPDGVVLAPVMPSACETVALPALCEGAGPARLVDVGDTAATAAANDGAPDRWTEVDLPPLPGVLGLELVRHHVGARVTAPQPHEVWGRGWRLSYEARWRRVAPAVIDIEQPDGTVLRFDRLQPGQGSLRGADRALGQVSSRRGAAGEELHWTWPNGRRLSFAPAGHLEQIVAPGGEFVSLRHDAQGRLLSVTDPQGRSLRLHYLDKVEAVPVMGYFGVRHADTPVGRFTFSYQPLRGDAPPPHVPVLAKVEWPTWVDPDRRAHRHANRPVSFSAEARVYHHEDTAQPWRLTGTSHQAQRGSDEWLTTPVTREAGAVAHESRMGAGPRATGVQRDPQGRLVSLGLPGGQRLHIDWDGDSDRPAQARLISAGSDAAAAAPVLARWRWGYNSLGQLVVWERHDAAGSAEMNWRHEREQQRSVLTGWSLADPRTGRTTVTLRHGHDAAGDRLLEVVLGPAPLQRWRFEVDGAGRWSQVHTPGGHRRPLAWGPRAGGPGLAGASAARDGLGGASDDITPWYRLVQRSQHAGQGTVVGPALDVQGLEPDRWVLIDSARRWTQPRRAGGTWQLARDSLGRLVSAGEVDARGQTQARHRFVHGPEGLQAHAVADASGVRAVGWHFDPATRQWQAATQHQGTRAGSSVVLDRTVYPLDTEGRPLGASLPGGLALAITWPAQDHTEAGSRAASLVAAAAAEFIHPGGQRERLDLTGARRWTCGVPCWWLPPVVRDASGRIVAHHVPVAPDQWVRIEVRDDEPAASEPGWRPVRHDASFWQALRSALAPSSSADRSGNAPAAPAGAPSRAWRLVTESDAP